MSYHFYKMHGCGNDYIYFDTWQQPIPQPGVLSRQISHRHFGVGGDGIVLIGPSHIADAQMRMFNTDGSEGRMCGNAIRCVGRFLYEKKGLQRDTLTVETLSGVKTLHMHTQQGQVTGVTVDMGLPILDPPSIPVELPGSQVVDHPLRVADQDFRITCVSMGNPHCVIFVQQDPFSLNLPRLGPCFEKHPLFPQGVNTEFVRVLSPTHLQMRVWERGSGETWACGTGACATAVAAILNGHSPQGQDIRLSLRGGDLTIRWEGKQVWMTGPATFVFEGEWPEQ
ncbi:MAG: diaminopimelate epimerase [Eubacteriales bacterium]|jgi:diaminopimelate epimerase